MTCFYSPESEHTKSLICYFTVVVHRKYSLFYISTSVNLNFVTEHHLYPSSVTMGDKVCKFMTVRLSKLEKANSKGSRTITENRSWNVVMTCRLS